MRKVKDYYFNKAKQENYPARSIYKLEEAQKKHRLLQAADKVLDLGCQPGSWSIYAAAIVGPAGLVVGVDLKEGKKIRRTNSAAIQWLAADITAPDTIDRIKALCASYNVVISDMAPQTSGNKWVDQQHSLRLAHRTLEVAGQVLAEGGNYYCKVFEGEDFAGFVKEVRSCFKTVKTIKPKSSRKESREVFVLGLGYLAGDPGLPSTVPA